MNNTFLKASLISCSVLALAACGGGGGNGTSDSNGLELFFTGPGTFDSSQPVSAGEVDLSTYVAVGDSLTAGFADGSLYRDGQINSFPNILSGVFSQAGGGAFTQPLVNDNLGGLIDGGGTPIPGFETRLVLASSPVRQSGTPTTIGDATSPLVGQTFNNLGVPGARVFQLGSAALAANPFYARFATAPGASDVVGDALLQAPSFFTLWIGNNDLLDFATSGGVNEVPAVIPPTSLADFDNRITPAATFSFIYDQLVTGLTSTGARGVLVNIPAIADIPFFTTVPTNAIELDATTAATVSAGFDGYNAGIQGALGAGIITAEEAAARTIIFQEGNNGVLIIDEALTVIQLPEAALGLSGIPGGIVTLPNFRQTTSEDVITLTGGVDDSGSTIDGVGNGIGDTLVEGEPSTTVGVAIPLGFTDPTLLANPLLFLTPLDSAIVTEADSRVLTAREIGLIETERAAYNATIETLANGNPNLAVYDAATDLASVNQGVLLTSTSNLSSTFVTGGGFSLDGVHPTATGYSLVANGILRTMNLAFDANLPFDASEERTRVFFQFPDGSPLLD